MESKHFTIGTRGFNVVVSEFKNFLMVHVRKYYEGKPTRFGIALTTKEWKMLMSKSKQIDDLLEQMQKVLDQQTNNPNTEPEELESETLRIGFRGYFTLVSDFAKTLYVHVRKYDSDEKASSKGIALTSSEWKSLMTVSDEIDVQITQLLEEIRQKNEKQLQESKDNLEPPAKKMKGCNEAAKPVNKRIFKAKIQ